ncbi:MAG: phage tail protein [Allosphingosinicella sp.]|uniref:phage tail protein n=1 Tax=Allosphingosinicella sp. TaxID=2823234 RepID=UPI00392E0F86
MLLAIGMFVFEVPTLAYDELQRRRDWRHARTNRIGARDASQFVGPGEDSISLSGTVYSEIADGRASLDTLCDMAGSGNSWPLVDAGGRVWGSFIITGIDERQKYFLPDGTPRRIDFGIDLALVDDAPAADG